MSNTTLTPTVGAATLAGAAGAIWPSSGFFYIVEYQSLAQDTAAGGGAQLVKAPPLATQVIQISGFSTPSQPFSAQTRIVRLHTDTTCGFFIGGAAPIARGGANGTGRLPANATEYFSVNGGDLVAVISST
jgi:hypothetical protein